MLVFDNTRKWASFRFWKKWHVKINGLQPSTPSFPKGNSNFEILIVEIFIQKKTNKSITSSYTFWLPVNVLVTTPSSRQGITIKNVQQKPFRLIQVYWDTSRSTQELFRTPCYPDIFRNLEYSKPWHIQN